jgi:hypothetical protein
MDISGLLSKEGIKQSFVFKKRTWNVNSSCKPVFAGEKNEILFAASNKIISFNYETGFIMDKFKIFKKNIKSFGKIENNLYCLSNDNEFYEYDFGTKTINKSYQFEDKNDSIRFVFSEYLNSFVFVSRKEVNILNRDSFSITNKIELLITIKPNNKNKQYVQFLDINEEKKVIIFSLGNNNLEIMNLLNQQIKTIEFQKPLTEGIFLSNDSVVIGDITGKMHFLQNILKNKVK